MPEERQFQAEQDVQAEANYAKIIQIEVVQTEADLEDIQNQAGKEAIQTKAEIEAALSKVQRENT